MLEILQQNFAIILIAIILFGLVYYYVDQKGKNKDIKLDKSEMPDPTPVENSLNELSEFFFPIVAYLLATAILLFLRLESSITLLFYTSMVLSIAGWICMMGLTHMEAMEYITKKDGFAKWWIFYYTTFATLGGVMVILEVLSLKFTGKTEIGPNVVIVFLEVITLGAHVWLGQLGRQNKKARLVKKLEKEKIQLLNHSNP